MHAPKWDAVWELSNRVRAGARLELTSRVRGVLRRAAREVAITDEAVSAALVNVALATALLRNIRTRIHKGSDRSVDALNRMYRLRDAGDLEGARQQMHDVLAVEVVPFYRWIAEGQLNLLDDWKPPKGKALARKAAPARKAPARKAPATAPARKAPAKAPARKAPAANQRNTGKQS